MAHGWFVDKLKSLDLLTEVEVDSCGTSAPQGMIPAENAVKILHELDIDISKFQTQAISREKVMWADKILAMSPNHREYILTQFPEVNPAQISVLNIPDPVGQGIEVYRQSFEMIKEALKKEIKKLVTLAIGSDHGGFELKQHLAVTFKENGYTVKDFGTQSLDSCDYPDFAFPVAEEVAKDKSVRGILICTSGGGVAMAANKVKGVRAVHCLTVEDAEFARRHNHINVLVLSGKKTSKYDAVDIVKKFISTGFDGGRHERRVGKIINYEENHWK
jgi:ribose 5-phosphate isomerase B